MLKAVFLLTLCFVLYSQELFCGKDVFTEPEGVLPMSTDSEGSTKKKDPSSQPKQIVQLLLLVYSDHMQIKKSILQKNRHLVGFKTFL